LDGDLVSEQLRPELQPIVAALLASGERVLDLDRVGEEIGAAAVTVDDIEQIFTALENAGRVIGDPHAAPASTLLKAVIAAARELQRELQRRPSHQEIATRAGISARAVNLALQFAQVLQR
jgi:hypothetical protein